MVNKGAFVKRLLVSLFVSVYVLAHLQLWVYVHVHEDISIWGSLLKISVSYSKYMAYVCDQDYSNLETINTNYNPDQPLTLNIKIFAKCNLLSS